MRAERHLTGHAQDRRRVDVGGEQTRVSGPRVRRREKEIFLSETPFLSPTFFRFRDYI